MLFDVRCPGCGAPRYRWGRPICVRCFAEFGPAVTVAVSGVDVVVAATAYEGVARQIVLAGKNRGHRSVFNQLSPVLVSGEVQGQWPSPPDVVTWVPASRSKKMRRGYDQGRILAVAVAGRIGLPVKRLLVRRSGHSQTGLSRQQRQSGPLLEGARPVGGSVLVVDDVVTTGASLQRAANVLRKVGANRVFATTISVRL